MLEIWGRKNSGNVMPVMWAVGELGLKHVRHNVGGSFGGLDTTQYEQLNPNRRIPTINDNGLILWESNTIVRYLAREYGRGTLWPDTPAAVAHADQWMEWFKTTVSPAYFPLFWGLIRTAPEKRDSDAISGRATSVGETLKILDHHLSEHRFVAGDSLTMGDIPLGAMAYRYFNLQIERPSLANVDRWYQLLCERPAYRQHVMIPFGSSPAEWLELEKAGADD